jgi:hypothetical protein
MKTPSPVQTAPHFEPLLSGKIIASNHAPTREPACLNDGQPREQSGHNLNETPLFKGCFRLAPLLLNSTRNLGTRKFAGRTKR